MTLEPWNKYLCFINSFFQVLLLIIWNGLKSHKNISRSRSNIQEKISHNIKENSHTEKHKMDIIVSDRIYICYSTFHILYFISLKIVLNIKYPTNIVFSTFTNLICIFFLTLLLLKTDSIRLNHIYCQSYIWKLFSMNVRQNHKNLGTLLN